MTDEINVKEKNAAEEAASKEAESEAPTKTAVDLKTEPKIDFDDFSKVEIKIGEIIEAEKVENADRLLKLKVDFGGGITGDEGNDSDSEVNDKGGEIRQIVSGIAEYYEPENLIGLKTPFVTNLKPRTIKGIESNGMILAAKDEEGNFSIMQVDQKIKKGTRLS